MEMTIARKVYIGSGENGARLMSTLEQLAADHCGGNVSRFLIYTVCEKYRINPKTGKPLKDGEPAIKCR
jgi:hypothetical protein